MAITPRRGLRHKTMTRQKLAISFTIVFCFISSVSWGDVRGTSGNVFFDVNAYGIKQITITTSGLGIGTTVPSANLHVMGNAFFSGSLGVGVSSPASSLEINGTLGFNLQTITSNTQLSGNTLVLADTVASNSNITITLPFSGNSTGRVYMIKKNSNSGNVTIFGHIDNMDQIILGSSSTGFPFSRLVCDGTQWYSLDLSGNTGSSTIASSNLVALWRFDQTSGNTVTDSSDNGFNGTGYNMNSSDWVQGKVGNALSFDGVNKYVRITNNAALDPLSQLTYACWIKPSVLNATIMGKNDLNVANFRVKYMALTSAGNLKFVDYNGTTNTYTATSGNEIQANTWQHVAITIVNNSVLKMYKDGSLIYTVAFGSDLLTEDEDFMIGAYLQTNSPLNFFNGLIDDVRVYNRALTPEEINGLYLIGQ